MTQEVRADQVPVSVLVPVPGPWAGHGTGARHGDGPLAPGRAPRVILARSGLYRAALICMVLSLFRAAAISMGRARE